MMQELHNEGGKGVHHLLYEIPVQDIEQVVRNAAIAANNGADGVFLTNYETSYRHLNRTYEEVRKKLPGLWTGLKYQNIIGHVSVLNVVPEGLQGLWVDNADVGDYGPSQRAFIFDEQRRELGWPMRYFGGIAFKKRKGIQQPMRAASLATPYVDVLTIRRDLRGRTPPLDQVVNLRNAVDGHPLAIAASMSLRDVANYMPHVDIFIVMPKIGQAGMELNSKEVRAFAKKLGK